MSRPGITYNNRHDNEIQSFSSSLLDKIYRSIDEGEKRKSDDLKFFRETMSTTRKQSRTKVMGEEENEEKLNRFRRACLFEKWIEKKVGEKVGNQRRKHYSEFDRKLDHENDALFFSSTSSSSDSSSGGFSSSDTESIFGARSATSSSVPARPKHVRTTVMEKKQREELYVFEDYHRSKERRPETPGLENDDVLIKSKSRALKIYSNLKKVKQPISPGGKLATFFNSLFTTNAKKSKSQATMTSSYQETSTCSSASSYSRSCLSKSSEKLHTNGVKRSVRFYPVSVIVGEDSRPCGHKCLYEEQGSALMPVSVPKAWKIGRSPVRKGAEDDQLKVKHQQVLEKTRRVEETAREFLRDYHQNQTKKKDLLTQLHRGRVRDNEEIEDEEFDDAASYSSSDLFELDHLAVIGTESRYQEELPVYETTRVDKNRAIANGLIM